MTQRVDVILYSVDACFLSHRHDISSRGIALDSLPVLLSQLVFCEGNDETTVIHEIGCSCPDRGVKTPVVHITIRDYL